ncbi:MAG: glutamyl-tRNA reductase [Candidatus Magnetoovum sp. WYHC-5]|nr:glutamyl-tRNA reductase [Candidatus Magnetoovum sp. WYHC-5]
MNIHVIGLNHKTADVSIREKIAFNGDKYVKGLEEINSLHNVEEAVLLSTCNRVELYVYANGKSGINEEVTDFLSTFHNVEKDKLNDTLYTYDGVEAVRHVFRVASSLDSMVVGEPQILGQLKDAFDEALSHNTSGAVLNKLMKKAISVAKRVRTETSIAENAVSISYAAVELAKKIFTSLDGLVCMLLGAGEMAELSAKHLRSSGVKEIIVANRTFERACVIAAEVNGRPIDFNTFKEEMKNTDIVICSTGAPTYVVSKKDMESVIKRRRNKPIFMIDISVPRNLDPDINNIDNVYLYDIDDLQGVVDSNVNARLTEAVKAEKIVDEELQTFERWFYSRNAVPTIVSLRQIAENIKNDELEKLFNKISGFDDKEKQAIEQMANTIVNKLIHPPTAALKEDTDDRDMLIETVRRIYSLNGKE